MKVKPALHGVALLALVAAASACGGQSKATKLQIEVRNNLGVHAYQLECNPPSGTAPQPKAICSQFARSPELLVGGRCAVSEYGEAFRVSGRYRGYPIEATFSNDCAVPGQGDGFWTWWSLMNDATPSRGVAEHQLGSPTADRKASKEQHAEALRLRAQIRALLPKRDLALASGSIKVGSLDRLQLRIMRDRLELHAVAQGLRLADATFYSSTSAGVARAFRSPVPLYRPGRPVYLAEVHLAYRDYAGRVHRENVPEWVSFDGPTLVGGFVSGAPSPDTSSPSLRLLGQPVMQGF